MEHTEREIARFNIEAATAILERIIKRLWLVIILLVILFFASNGAWLLYLSQYDVEIYGETYTQDGSGLNIIGDRNGVIFDGPNSPPVH